MSSGYYPRPPGSRPKLGLPRADEVYSGQVGGPAEEYLPPPKSVPQLPRSFRPIAKPGFQPNNPASTRRLTLAEQAHQNAYDSEQSDLRDFEQHQRDVAQDIRERAQERQAKRDQDKAQRAAESRHGLKSGTATGFFTDAQGRLRPLTKPKGFQYHTRTDDGKVVGLHFDPESKTYFEKDPIEAGTFELDPKGNKVIRVAGEGRKAHVVEPNLGLKQAQETKSAVAQAKIEKAQAEQEHLGATAKTKDAREHMLRAEEDEREIERAAKKPLQSAVVAPAAGVATETPPAQPAVPLSPALAKQALQVATENAQKADEAQKETERQALDVHASNPLLGFRALPSDAQRAMAKKAADDARERLYAARDAETQARDNHLRASQRVVEKMRQGISVADAIAHPRYASDKPFDPIQDLGDLALSTLETSMPFIKTAKAAMGVGGIAWQKTLDSMASRRPEPTVGTPQQPVSAPTDPEPFELLKKTLVSVGAGEPGAQADLAALQGKALGKAAAAGLTHNIGAMAAALIKDASATRYLIDTFAAGAAAAKKTDILQERIATFDRLVEETAKTPDAEAWVRMRDQAREQLATVEQTVSRDLLDALGPVLSSPHGVPYPEQVKAILRFAGHTEQGVDTPAVGEMLGAARATQQRAMVSQTRAEIASAIGDDSLAPERLDLLTRRALDRAQVAGRLGMSVTEARSEGIFDKRERDDPAEVDKLFAAGGALKSVEQRALDNAARGYLERADAFARQAAGTEPGAWQTLGQDEAAFQVRARPDLGPDNYDFKFPTGAPVTADLGGSDLVAWVSQNHADRFSQRGDALTRAWAGVGITTGNVARSALSAVAGVARLGVAPTEHQRADLRRMNEGTTAFFRSPYDFNEANDLRALTSDYYRIRNGFLDNIGQLPVNFATRGLGLTAQFASNVLLEGVETYDDAKAHGASEDAALALALGKGMANGAVETVADRYLFGMETGVAKLLPAAFTKRVSYAFRKELPGYIAKPLGTASIGGLAGVVASESGTEMFQQLIGNGFAQFYDPTRPFAEGVADSGIIGGLIGAAARGPDSIVTGYKEVRAALKYRDQQKALAQTSKAAAQATPAAVNPARPTAGTADGSPTQPQSAQATVNLSKELGQTAPLVLGSREAVADLVTALQVPTLQLPHTEWVDGDTTADAVHLALAVGQADGAANPAFARTAGKWGMSAPEQQQAAARFISGRIALGEGVRAVLAGQPHPSHPALVAAGVLTPESRIRTEAIGLLPPAVRDEASAAIQANPDIAALGTPDLALRDAVGRGSATLRATAQAVIDASPHLVRLPEVVEAALKPLTHRFLVHPGSTSKTATTEHPGYLDIIAATPEQAAAQALRVAQKMHGPAATVSLPGQPQPVAVPQPVEETAQPAPETVYEPPRGVKEPLLPVGVKGFSSAAENVPPAPTRGSAAIVSEDWVPVAPGIASIATIPPPSAPAAPVIVFEEWLPADAGTPPAVSVEAPADTIDAEPSPALAFVRDWIGRAGPVLERLGVTVTEASGVNTALRATTAGDIVINPELLDQDAANDAAHFSRAAATPTPDATAAAWQTSLKARLTEELWHAAELSHLRERWNIVGQPGTFEDFVRSHARALLETLRRTNPQLIEAAQDAYGREHIARSPESDRAAVILAEATRMALQQRAAGNLGSTEEVSAMLGEPILRHLRSVLSYLRRLFTDWHALPADFRSHVEAVESLLADALAPGRVAAREKQSETAQPEERHKNAIVTPPASEASSEPAPVLDPTKGARENLENFLGHFNAEGKRLASLPVSELATALAASDPGILPSLLLEFPDGPTPEQASAMLEGFRAWEGKPWPATSYAVTMAPKLSRIATIEALEAPTDEETAEKDRLTREIEAALEPARLRLPEGTPTVEMVTPRGEMTITTSFAVVDRDQLVDSSSPDYPQDLQPRDRTSSRSAAQVLEIAQNLDPERLWHARTTDLGGPLVTPFRVAGVLQRTPDGRPRFLVVSGNGRTQAIARARAGALSDYRAAILGKAAAESLPVPDAIQTPVAIHIYQPTTAGDLITLARLSNQDDKLSQSPYEIADADADAIRQHNLLAVWSVPESGNMLAAQNWPFISAFLRRIGQQGLIDGHGHVSPAALPRVRNAMLSLLVGDTREGRRLLQTLIEQRESLGLSRVIDALTGELGSLLALESSAPTYSLRADLATALDRLVAYKHEFEQGTVRSVDEFLSQSDAFIAAPSQLQAALLHHLAEAPSIKAARAPLAAYRALAQSTDASGPDMFGVEPPDSLGLWERATRALEFAARRPSAMEGGLVAPLGRTAVGFRPVSYDTTPSDSFENIARRFDERMAFVWENRRAVLARFDAARQMIMDRPTGISYQPAENWLVERLNVIRGHILEGRPILSTSVSRRMGPLSHVDMDAPIYLDNYETHRESYNLAAAKAKQVLLNAIGGDEISFSARRASPGWHAFPPAAGGLGIERGFLPQIPTDDRSALNQWLEARGVMISAETVPSWSLHPSQAEYSPEKVRRSIERAKTTTRRILISEDNYLLDGHHQWLANYGGPVDVYRLDLLARPALALISQFPSAAAEAKTKTRYESEAYPYLGLPTEDWRTSRHPEAAIVNPIDPTLDPDSKVDALNQLTEENLTLVQALLNDLAALGLEGQHAKKLPDRIQAKASRPSIRGEKPWHDVEHIRDGLRFKVKLLTFEQIPEITDAFQRHGMEIVKFDSSKMFSPKAFGWRFVGFDLRFPNGQLVEFYSALTELDDKAVKGPNHELFEKWRNVPQGRLEEDFDAQAEYTADLRESFDRYAAAFETALSRLGFADSNEARASFAMAVARVGSSTTANFSINSSAEAIPLRHLPSLQRLSGGEDRSRNTTAISPFSASYTTGAFDAASFTTEDRLISSVSQLNSADAAIRDSLDLHARRSPPPGDLIGDLFAARQQADFADGSPEARATTLLDAKRQAQLFAPPSSIARLPEPQLRKLLTYWRTERETSLAKPLGQRSDADRARLITIETKLRELEAQSGQGFLALASRRPGYPTGVDEMGTGPVNAGTWLGTDEGALPLNPQLIGARTFEETGRGQRGRPVHRVPALPPAGDNVDPETWAAEQEARVRAAERSRLESAGEADAPAREIERVTRTQLATAQEAAALRALNDRAASAMADLEAGQGATAARKQTAAEKAGPPGALAYAMLSIVAGRKDVAERLAPGYKRLEIEKTVSDARVAAALLELGKEREQLIERGLGGKRFWDALGIGYRRRRAAFARKFHLVAARLNPTAFTPDGEFTFGYFEAKMRTVTAGEAKRQGWQPGYFEWDGLWWKLSEPREDLEGEMQLYLTLDPLVQASIYNDFAGEFPDLVPLLDQFISPGLEKARLRTIAGAETPVFNRHSLFDFFASTPFGPLQHELAGYTPDVVRWKVLAGIRGQLAKFKEQRALTVGAPFKSTRYTPRVSGARNLKTGVARESGNVIDIFGGFDTRAWEAHTERAERDFAIGLLQAGLRPLPPSGKVPAVHVVIDKRALNGLLRVMYLATRKTTGSKLGDLHSAISAGNFERALNLAREMGARIANADLPLIRDYMQRMRAAGLPTHDRTIAFLDESSPTWNPVERHLLHMLLAEEGLVASVIAGPKTLPKRLLNEMGARFTATQIDNWILNLPIWLLRRWRTGIVSGLSTLTTNWIQAQAHYAHRLLTLPVQSLAEYVTDDRRNAQLHLRQALEMAKSAVFRRPMAMRARGLAAATKELLTGNQEVPRLRRAAAAYVEQRKLFERMAPLGIYGKGNSLYGILDHDQRTSVTGALKRLDVGGAILTATRAGHVDQVAKQLHHISVLIADAHTRASEAGLKGEERKKFIRETLAKPDPAVDAVAVAGSHDYVMDFSNVPHWLDPDASLKAGMEYEPALGPLKREIKANVFLFGRVLYSVARYAYTTGIDPAVYFGTMGGQALMAAVKAKTRPSPEALHSIGQAFWLSLKRDWQRRHPVTAAALGPEKLANAAAWGLMLALVSAWWSDDDDDPTKAPILGSDFDVDGNPLESWQRTGGMGNLSRIAKPADAALRAVLARTGLADEEALAAVDFYWRLRALPQFSYTVASRQMVEGVKDLTATGDWAKLTQTKQAIFDLWNDTANLGLASALYHAYEGKGGDRFNPNRGTAQQLAMLGYDVGTAWALPTPYRNWIGDTVDPIARRKKDATAPPYTHGVKQELMRETPGLSHALPPAGLWSRPKALPTDPTKLREVLAKATADVAAASRLIGPDASRVPLVSFDVDDKGRRTISTLDPETIRRFPHWQQLLRYTMRVKATDRDDMILARQGLTADQVEKEQTKMQRLEEFKRAHPGVKVPASMQLTPKEVKAGDTYRKLQDGGYKGGATSAVKAIAPLNQDPRRLDLADPSSWATPSGLTVNPGGRQPRVSVPASVRQNVAPTVAPAVDYTPRVAIDPNTQAPLVPGRVDLGHKPGREFRTLRVEHAQSGGGPMDWTRKNQDPALYQFEDSASNRSHEFEAPPPPPPRLRKLPSTTKP